MAPPQPLLTPHRPLSPMGAVCDCLMVIWATIVISASSVGSDVASLPERGKFGFVGEASSFLQLEEVDGFPNSVDFFENYVFQSKPLIMRGAAKMSPAFQLWQEDDYFLKQEIPEDEPVTVETTKKENRTQEILEINFREFLESYKQQDRYMVHRVPEYLGQDVIIPYPLQCPNIYQNSIVEAIMWFSAGGTKSVVHTDSVDNMNCVYVGDKHFVMINHRKDADKVVFDHPEGAYSDIDVDAVDYDKYPSLLSVEYYHVDLEAGDCLFIPYKWIHQVRSYGPRNIAINIWWDTHRNHDVDLGACSEDLNPQLTLDKVEYIGFREVMQSVDAIKDQFHDHTRHTNLTFSKYISFNIGTREMQTLGGVVGYQIPLKEIFRMIDKDGDGLMTHQEVKDMKDKEWERVIKQLSRFDAIMEAIHRRLEEEAEAQGQAEGGESWRVRDEL